ncbi:hypothetical protein RCL1_003313 [Eukaryota sp. TZLM3-RCL]
MRMSIFFLIVLISQISAILVDFSVSIRDVSTPTRSILSVNNGQTVVYPSSNGRFSMILADNSTFVLDISHPDYIFPTKILSTNDGKAFIVGTTRHVSSLTITPIKSVDIIITPLSTQLLTFIKRPIVIIGIIMLVAMVGLKMATGSMSPEEREQLERQTRTLQSGNPLDLFRNLTQQQHEHQQ